MIIGIDKSIRATHRVKAGWFVVMTCMADQSQAAMPALGDKNDPGAAASVPVLLLLFLLAVGWLAVGWFASRHARRSGPWK